MGRAGIFDGALGGIESPIALFLSGFLGTLIAAGLLIAIHPLTTKRHGQEAAIGLVYVLAMTIAMALISSTGLEGHHLRHMLSGHLLFVSPMEAVSAMGLYAIIGGIAFLTHKQLLLSKSPGWHFIFYALFGLVVTSSVKMVGILLVFSLLVIPSLTAMLWFDAFKPQLLLGWGIGIIGAIFGMGMAMALDIPLSLCIILAIMAVFFMSLLKRRSFLLTRP